MPSFSIFAFRRLRYSILLVSVNGQIFVSPLWLCETFLTQIFSIDGGNGTILDVMERTMAGEKIYPDETPLIRIGYATNHDFTERELDILKELTTGDTNKEIANYLHISVSTVKSHIRHLMEKIGFKTRTELVSQARGLGIVIKEKW